MTVEFFGVPRERAGVAELTLRAETLGELLGLLSDRLPSFREFVLADRLHPTFAVNLNGDRFVTDPSTPLAESDAVLILSADAGG